MWDPRPLRGALKRILFSVCVLDYVWTIFFSECIFLVVWLSNIHNAAFLVLFLSVDGMVMYSFTFCVCNHSSPGAANSIRAPPLIEAVLRVNVLFGSGIMVKEIAKLHVKFHLQSWFYFPAIKPRELWQMYVYLTNENNNDHGCSSGGTTGFTTDVQVLVWVPA